MGGSNTGKTNQVNTTEIHSAVNNQDLSKDIKINDVTNIRNYDIVNGNDIGGGQNTFNAILNTSTGKQIFKLQELSNNFTLAPNMSNNADLQSGEIINGTAGQVTIKGDDNIFKSGNSKSDAKSDGKGSAGASSSTGGDDAAAARALKAQMGKLMELDFTFAPEMSGYADLKSGEIINGTAGQVTITGNDNEFHQGNSKSDATSSGSGGSAGAKSSTGGGDDAAAAAALKAQMDGKLMELLSATHQRRFQAHLRHSADSNRHVEAIHREDDHTVRREDAGVRAFLAAQRLQLL